MALVRAVQRQEQVVVVAAQAAHRELLATDRDVAGEDAEVVALEGERGPDLAGRARRSTSAASGSCSPTTATAPALMMPPFSVAISSTELPRNRSWSIAIGVTTATWPSTTFVASHEPPMPTSTTATSTGASANAA